MILAFSFIILNFNKSRWNIFGQIVFSPEEDRILFACSVSCVLLGVTVFLVPFNVIFIIVVFSLCAFCLYIMSGL